MSFRNHVPILPIDYERRCLRKRRRRVSKAQRNHKKVESSIPVSIESNQDRKKKSKKQEAVESKKLEATLEKKEAYVPPRKTEAEVKFEEAKKQRQRDKITQIASVSHKERVAVRLP